MILIHFSDSSKTCFYCSIENLQAFVSDLDEGSLEAYVKSQPIPESNDGPVMVAVGKTFDDVVMNNGKDT